MAIFCISKMDVSHRLGFLKYESCTIRSADPENRSLHVHQAWSGLHAPFLEIFTFKLYCDLETGVQGHSRYRKRHYSTEHIRLYIHLPQANRELQRGPGKHYHGVLPPASPILYVLRSRHQRRQEGGNVGKGVPHHPTRGSGSVASSPSGVRGKARAENGFYAYFRSERSHLEHHFQYF